MVDFLCGELCLRQFETINQLGATQQSAASSTLSEMYPSAARCVARTDFPILLPTENFVEPLLLHNEGDFRRSFRTAPFTCPFLADALLCVALVPPRAFAAFVSSNAFAAFVSRIALGVALVPEVFLCLSPASSSIRFKARVAERCSQRLGFLSTSSDVTTNSGSSSCSSSLPSSSPLQS